MQVHICSAYLFLCWASSSQVKRAAWQGNVASTLSGDSLAYSQGGSLNCWDVVFREEDSRFALLARPSFRKLPPPQRGMLGLLADGRFSTATTSLRYQESGLSCHWASGLPAKTGMFHVSLRELVSQSGAATKILVWSIHVRTTGLLGTCPEVRLATYHLYTTWAANLELAPLPMGRSTAGTWTGTMGELCSSAEPPHANLSCI